MSMKKPTTTENTMTQGTKIQISVAGRTSTFTFDGEIDVAGRFPHLHAHSGLVKQWVLRGARGGLKVVDFFATGACFMRPLYSGGRDEMCEIVG